MGLVVRNVRFDGFFKGTFPQVPPPPPAPSDQYSQYTVLNLPGTGTNNTNNNVFVDGSSNNFAITRFGNTTQGSFSPFSTAPGYWSNYFDGSGDTLTLSANSAFAFGTGNFTIECWVYVTGYPSNYSAIATNRIYNGSSGAVWGFFIGSTGGCWFNQVLVSGAQFVGSGNTAIPLNTWTHIAVVRSSTSTNGVTMYFNGQVVGQATMNANFSDSSNALRIGEAGDGVSGWFNGYISNLRIVKGTAVYTGNFTSPTTPLTVISGTSLLTCQSNRFIDNSSNNFAITRNGDTSVSAFGPFAAASAYNAATAGGSMYFDGSGDYINAPNNSAFVLGSGDFTIEAWVYQTATSANNKTIFGTGSPGYSLYINSSNELNFVFEFITNHSSAIAVPLFSWVHLAVSRASSTLKMFINGTQVYTASSSTSVSSINVPNSGINFPGYISNLRVIKGTGLYTTNFTPPTAPVSAISGTSLLLNGTNAAIYDTVAKNNLETAGDAKVSTTISANGSMYFDGTGDYLTIPSSPNLAFQTGDFTAECWVYRESTSTMAIMDYASAGGFGINIEATQIVPFQSVTIGYVATATVPLNTWTHVAVTRQGTTLRTFMNGNLVGTSTTSVNFTSPSTLNIGRNPGAVPPTFFMIGYLQDLRLTKGIARYTSTFTPPTRS